jgi:hypothetical protein
MGDFVNKMLTNVNKRVNTKIPQYFLNKNLS